MARAAKHCAATSCHGNRRGRARSLPGMPTGTVALARLAAAYGRAGRGEGSGAGEFLPRRQVQIMIIKRKIIIILEPCAARTAGVADNPPLDRQASWHHHPVHAAMSMHIRPRPFLLICSGPVARFATAVVAPAASASASGALQIARGPSARPPATTTWARCSGLAAQKREADPARRDHVGDSEDLLLDHVGDRLRDHVGDQLTWFT